MQAINGKDYYPAVKEALQEAEKSIYMVMYQVALHSYDKDSKAYKLVDELVKARNRGVIVKVILDQNIDFVSPAHMESWQKELAKDLISYFNEIKIDKDAVIPTSNRTLKRS